MEKFKNITIKNKKVIILIAILLLLITIISVFTAYSLFSDVKNEEENLKIGKVEVILKENSPWEENEDEFGVENVYTKSVKGVSVAEQDAYVRIRCIPVVEYYMQNINASETAENGEWITAPVSQEDITLAINSENWIQDGEYWYYKNILHGFEETEELNIDWQVLEIPSEISFYPIRTDVRVILEYSQASNNMWKDIFKIEELPEGVELVQE